MIGFVPKCCDDWYTTWKGLVQMNLTLLKRNDREIAPLSKGTSIVLKVPPDANGCLISCCGLFRIPFRRLNDLLSCLQLNRST